MEEMEGWKDGRLEGMEVWKDRRGGRDGRALRNYKVRLDPLIPF